MRTRLLGTITIAALALAACGGDDDDGGGSGGAQDEVADMMIEVLNETSDVEGVDVEIDEDCIRDRLSELSDEDAQAIVDAGVDGEPDISAEADAIAESLFECVDLGDINLDELDTDG